MPQVRVAKGNFVLASATDLLRYLGGSGGTTPSSFTWTLVDL